MLEEEAKKRMLAGKVPYGQKSTGSGAARDEAGAKLAVSEASVASIMPCVLLAARVGGAVAAAPTYCLPRPPPLTASGGVSVGEVDGYPPPVLRGREVAAAEVASGVGAGHS